MENIGIMSRLGGALLLPAIVLAATVLLNGRALAQDNYEAGKKPAQMFANDCGACHKSPAGLSKASGLFGLESFLREHYTASREAARVIAAYIRTIDAAQPPERSGSKRRKGEPRPKAVDKPGSKPAADKPAEAKTDAKVIPDKPAEPTTERKPAADTPAADKPAAEKPAESPAAPAANPDKSD